MNLYVANATAKRWQFLYRRPGKPDTASLNLDPGEQSVISNLEPHEEKSIIDQIELYGGIDVSDAKTERRNASLVFSKDRPVPYGKFAQRIQNNVEAIQRMGCENLEKSAKNVAEVLKNNGVKTGNADGDVSIQISSDDKDTKFLARKYVA